MLNQEQMNTNQNKIFESHIEREISNFKTGEKYKLEGGNQMVLTENDVNKIVEICNQENTYEMLFRKLFNNKEYTIEDAKNFINKVKAGWRNQNEFIFFVRKIENEIIGAIDIKSTDKERAEVGYWSDENYSGFMTNTLNELIKIAKEAGYKKLFAGVRDDNDKSINVLIRAGFIKTESMKKNKTDVGFEYEREL